MIKIILHQYLAKDTYRKEIIVNIDGDVPLESLLKIIDVSLNEVGIIIVNGQWQSPKYVVKDGDTVELFPNILGG